MERTVLIFIQLITVIFCDYCPPGFLWQREASKCCKPIEHCERGHQVKPCKESFGPDYCAPCPTGQTNSFNTSSFDMKICRLDSCQSDTILDSNGKCMCNLLKGYFGENSKLCNNGGKLCPKGRELKQDGDCRPCSYGYYKDWEGRGFCKKQINCTALRLEYKGYGNGQESTICRTQQTISKDPDDSERIHETNTLGITPEKVSHIAVHSPSIHSYTSLEPKKGVGSTVKTREMNQVLFERNTQNLMVARTEKSVMEPFTEQDFKSDSIKNHLSTKENLFTCNFQIIVAVLGLLLFLSSLLIVYLIIKKKSTVKKVNAPLKPTISDVGRCNSWNQRPLPIVPRERTLSTPEYDQYIPMNASRHASCSSSSYTQENCGVYKQQDIKEGWRCHVQDTYNNNLPSPLNESTYVKIEPVSSNYHT